MKIFDTTADHPSLRVHPPSTGTPRYTPGREKPTCPRSQRFTPLYSLGLSVGFPSGRGGRGPHLVMFVVEYARFARVRVVPDGVGGRGARRTAVVESEQGGQVGRRVQEDARLHGGHENGSPRSVRPAAAAPAPAVMMSLQLPELRVQGVGETVSVHAAVAAHAAAFSATARAAVTAVDHHERGRRSGVFAAVSSDRAAVFSHRVRQGARLISRGTATCAIYPDDDDPVPILWPADRGPHIGGGAHDGSLRRRRGTRDSRACLERAETKTTTTTTASDERDGHRVELH